MQARNFLPIWDLVKSRVITFYALVVLASLTFVDYDAIIYHAQSAALSRLMPNFSYITDLINGRQELDKERLKKNYLFYYQKVVDYTYRPEALGMLGYIYFHLGKDKDAVSCFKRAIAFYPDAFNFHYNLGVIYFRRGYYGEAVESLEKAVATSVDKNLNFVTSSKIYFPVLPPVEDLGYQLKLHFKNGFRSAYRLLILSCFNLKEYQQMLRYTTEAITAALDKDKDLYYFAGLAAFEVKKYEQAGAFLKIYLDYNPNDGVAFYYLGLTLQALGDQIAARKVLERAEQLHYSEKAGVTAQAAEADMISMSIF